MSSEKKYGAPVACEQCKLNCAFQKTTESREKVRKGFFWQDRSVSYENNNVAMLAGLLRGGNPICYRYKFLTEGTQIH